MKALKITSIIVVTIIAVLAVLIGIQPSQGHIEKSIVINAPPSVIFPEVSNYKNFNAWSPWNKMDPEVKQTYEGPDGGVGSRMSWDGPKTGKGSQWIEELEENKRVKSRMSFEGFDETYYSEFTLNPEGDGTRVTWTYDGPNSGITGRAMWVIMGSVLESQYEEGLQDLKQVVEGKPTP